MEEREKLSIDTTKEIIESKKKAAKGRGITFKPYIDDVKTCLSAIEEKRAKIRHLGSERLLAKQRSMGKLTARERIDLLFDAGAFVERGIFSESQVKEMGMGEYHTPAGGVICGFGEVNNRRVCAYSTDYTVLAGSSGEGHSRKIVEITKLAGAANVPIVGLIDSAGARLHEAAQCLPPYYEIFWLQSNLSGVIPQITVICGGWLLGKFIHLC